VEQEHPNRNAKDAAYTPPNSQNVGAAVKVLINKAAIPAYKALPPVYDASVVVDVYKRAMDMSISITQQSPR
jgi:hypothetical protein